MNNSRSNVFFWLCLVIGALILTVQTISIFGLIGAPLGIGSGASLGVVVYYLGTMIWSAARWIRQQLKRP